MSGGGVSLIILALIILVVLLWLVAAYNGFVRLRNIVQASWRQIDVELHRRYDLIPNLVETVQGIAAHERTVLGELTRARAAVANAPASDPVGRAKQEEMLSSAIGRLFAVAEAYPQLRAVEGFAGLQRELANTEDRIAAGRRFYNANVRSYNTKTESFPSSIVASVFDFHRARYFEMVSGVARQSPQASLPEAQHTDQQRPSRPTYAVGRNRPLRPLTRRDSSHPSVDPMTACLGTVLNPSGRSRSQ